ncbi:MAG: sensor histidine kinase [Chloroflexota bacterium]|nr:sensor histidine kinase [Chloroflexota bacterium]
MPAHFPVAPDPQAGPRRMPAVVNVILVFFYVVILGLVALFTAAVAGEPTLQGSGYQWPVAAFVLLYAAFFVVNWLGRPAAGYALSDLLWGQHGQDGPQVVFVLLSLGCIAWMTATVSIYAWMYISICCQTFSMFRLRVSLPLLALELGLAGYQTGLIADLVAGRLPVDFWGSLFGVGFAMIYAVLITVLIRSRMQSEHLVHELRQTQERLEAALVHEREAAALRERTRMAREMHDVLGHALALVAVKIEVAQRLQAVDPARAAAELDATKALVRDSMADLRASLADLRSPTLEAAAGPLGAALTAWATRTAAEGGFALRCTVAPEADALPAPIQDALWRVAREAILNVVKHARAGCVELHVFCKGDAVYLSVGDDGVGIPHLAEGQARLEVTGHYGVRGMRERLAALGGQLSIRPGPTGHGTLVLATIPLPPPAPPAAAPIRARLPPALSSLFRRSSH